MTVLEEVRAQFGPSGVYLNTATVGLASRRTLDAMAGDMELWRRGDADPVVYDAAVDAARRSFARIVHVPPGWVAVGSQASAFVGLIAASVPSGSRIVLVEGDFTSVMFPALLTESRGVRVDVVGLDDLVGHLDESVSWVMVSAVQSADGRVVDVEGLAAAAGHFGIRVLLDTTQSSGWLDLDASRFDVTVCSAYKWLLAPRGVAFMTVAPHLWDEISPLWAGWYAGEDIWTSIYGAPLRLAADAARFNTSPAWLAWIGAVPALALVEEVGVEVIGRHNRRLTARAAAAFGVGDPGSAIVSLAVPIGDRRAALDAALAAGGIRVAERAGSLRVACHLYNTDADVDALVDALGPA